MKRRYLYFVLFLYVNLSAHPTKVHNWLIGRGAEILCNDKGISLICKDTTRMKDPREPFDGVMWPDHTTTTPGHPIDMDRFNWTRL